MRPSVLTICASCTGGQTGGFSHRAFDLPHRHYADTDWAAKTPYWF
jgi:hypothetical protein